MNPKEFYTRRSVVVVLATLCCLLWGSAYPSIKGGYALLHIASQDIPAKMLFAGYRFALAGLILLAFAVWQGRRVVLNSRQLGQVSLLGLTQTALQYVFFYVGLAYTTGVKGAIMNATGTFFSVLLAHFLYRNDRLNGGRIAGCLLGFAGVMVVNFRADQLDFHFSLAGEGSVTLAAFILSAASIYGKKVSQTMDSIVMTAWQLTLGGALLTAVGYATGGHLDGFTVAAVLLLGYMALLSAAAFALWSLLLKYNRVSLVSVFNFLVPVFGAALSALFLGETILEWKNAVALACVCGGIAWVTREAPATPGANQQGLPQDGAKRSAA